MDVLRSTDLFNPKILDASIRDISTLLGDKEKAELLLYAMRNLSPEGSRRTRTLIENATQSCLQLSTINEDTRVKARILHARAKIANGNLISAQDDLKAVLLFDPENAEAKALLNSRSLAIEQLLPDSEAAFRGTSGIVPRQLERVSMEIWREIALFLPRRDLKTLLFVPHILSRVASQLLFRELDLHFSSSDAGMGESDDEGTGGPGGSPSGLIAGGLVGLSSMGMGMGGAGGIVASSHPSSGIPSSYTLYEERERDEGRHAQRTADILTRLIVDQKFGSAVRTLKIFCSSRRDRDGSLAFQTGMLTNVLPKLVNLKNVYLSATSESIIRVLRILQVTGTKLHGLSLHSPDAPADLSFLEIRNLSHFSYTTSGGTLSSLSPLFTTNQPTLSSLSLENLHPSPHWTFPTANVSVRNLLSLNFTGHFGKDHGAAIMGEILREGRQLETLTVVCCSLESSGLSREFRSASFGWGAGIMPGPSDGGLMVMNPFGGSSSSLSMNTNGTPVALPFLRNFAFTVASLGRRTVDRDLFPSIAEFLRGRRRLRSLRLIASCDEHSNDVQSMQSAVGFEAAVWGVLPSLEGLKALGVTYPSDLSAGLACWLIPRSVKALTLSVDYGSPFMRDPVNWLNALRHGVPPNLKFIGLSDLNIRHAAEIVDRGFPMVRVVRVGQNYWTVHRRKVAPYNSSPPMSLPPARSLPAPAPAGHGHFPASSSPRASTSHNLSTTTPYGSAPLSSAAAASSSRSEGRSPGGTSHADKLVNLARPATHTGHPHSGHTHGHPGSSNPHPPHQQGAPSVSSSHYASSPGAGSSGGGHHGASGYGSGGIMGAGILHSSSGPSHRSSAPSTSGPSGSQERGGCLLSSSGPVPGPSGSGTMTELELWPRRRVLYHAAEWLEWLGCEDALVRDTSAYPAWTMCM